MPFKLTDDLQSLPNPPRPFAIPMLTPSSFPCIDRGRAQERILSILTTFASTVTGIDVNLFFPQERR